MKDIPKLIESADIVVHASTLGEPFGQVIAEAMSGGRAVIATDGGGVPEIITHAQNGLLVPMSDVRAMADAIGRLINDSRQLRRRLGTKARKHIQENLSIEITADKVQQIYSKLIRPTER